MKPWLCPAALALVGVLFSLGQSPSSSPTAIPQTPLGSSTRLVGAASCAAAACHNANYTRGQVGSEFTHWMTNDRHARAYEALFEPKAIAIMARLGTRTKAHEDARCLKCHVHPDYAEAETRIACFKTDGVSCENCHGPARDWLAEHYQPSWRKMSAADKAERGMADTQSPLGRARACVACHVGAAGMEVDHDLIAAGHPRLHFEFAAYHAALPHHWDDAKDRDPARHPRGRRDFEAHAWALGQLVTAQASLALLAHRTSEKHVNWPEFAEFDCAACHHRLQEPRDRQRIFSGHKLGALLWGGSLAVARHAIYPATNSGLTKAITELQSTMQSDSAQRSAIHASASRASILLDAHLRNLDFEHLSATTILNRYFAAGSAPMLSSDEWMQARLGLTALHLGGIRFMPTADMPAHVVRSYEPRTLRDRLSASIKSSTSNGN